MPADYGSRLAGFDWQAAKTGEKIEQNRRSKKTRPARAPARDGVHFSWCPLYLHALLPKPLTSIGYSGACWQNFSAVHATTLPKYRPRFSSEPLSLSRSSCTSRGKKACCQIRAHRARNSHICVIVSSRQSRS